MLWLNFWAMPPPRCNPKAITVSKVGAFMTATFGSVKAFLTWDLLRVLQQHEAFLLRVLQQHEALLQNILCLLQDFVDVCCFGAGDISL